MSRNVRQLLRTPYRRVRNALYRTGAEFEHRLVSMSIVRRLWRFLVRRRESGSNAVLLTAPGNGNIGDQAMLEVFLEQVQGPVVVLARTATAVTIPDWATDKVRVICLPHLIYGSFLAWVAALLRYARVLRTARSFSLIGADIMDGKYNTAASTRRSLVAKLAGEVGVPSRILGFSWNQEPAPVAELALRSASRAGVDLMLRDPVSIRRAQDARLANVVEVADTVFAAAEVDPAELTHLADGSGKLALVNVSGYVASTVPPNQYVEIVDYLLGSGLQVVLVPHVSRAGADDVAACEALAARFPDESVQNIGKLLRPAQIRALCRESAFVVTGRMHLAVMALGQGVPAVTLATQGKVEGLMQMFGLPWLCVNPAPAGSVGSRVVKTLQQLADGADARAQIANHLPAVRALSERNFAGL